MIYSNFDATCDCVSFPGGIGKGIAFLREHAAEFATMEPGTYPIDGDLVYAKVFDLTSAPLEQIPAEAHDEFMDIQYWVTGEENMGFAGRIDKYNLVKEMPENDTNYYDNVFDERFLYAKAGDFVIFFPGELHRPGVMTDVPIDYRKVVVKVSKKSF